MCQKAETLLCWERSILSKLVFPVVIYGCESWTVKKSERWRIDDFKPWCWRKLLSFPWTARRSNQSILMEINPEYSLQGLIVKLKLWYFGHLIQRMTDWKGPWCWEDRRQEGRETTEDEIVWWHHDSMDMSLSKVREMVVDREAWRVAVHGVAKSGIWLSDWTTTKIKIQHGQLMQ